MRNLFKGGIRIARYGGSFSMTFRTYEDGWRGVLLPKTFASEDSLVDFLTSAAGFSDEIVASAISQLHQGHGYIPDVTLSGDQLYALGLVN